MKYIGQNNAIMSIVMMWWCKLLDNLQDIQECNHGIFGSHYDEGRITRSLDPDPIWAEIGQRSIARYRELEQRTGRWWCVLIPIARYRDLEQRTGRWCVPIPSYCKIFLYLHIEKYMLIINICVSCIFIVNV